MKRIVWTFGLIAGAIMAAMIFITMAFQDQIGTDKGEIIGYTTMILAFLMVYFGIRSYRDNVMAGTIGFGRAFKVGILITLVASACYVAAWELVLHTLAPDFAEKYAALIVEKARAGGGERGADRSEAKGNGAVHGELQKPRDQRGNDVRRGVSDRGCGRVGERWCS